MGDISSGQATLRTYAEYIEKTMGDIAALMDKIKDGGDSADSYRNLHNIWEQMKACPLLKNPRGEFNAQEQVHYLSTLDTQWRKLVVIIGHITIPDRLNSWLRGARPGYYIPFHSVFEDELPNFEDRVKLLNFLASNPEAVKNGLVDVENGLIYRYSQDPKSRRKSFFLLAAALGVAVGIIVGASYLPLKDWPLQSSNLSVVLIGWFAVVAGVVVHMGVGIGKRIQSQRGHPPIISIGDLPLLVDAKIGPILLKILFTLIGFFGLVFASGIDDVKVFNAFLVGYTLDSVVELFGESVEQRAATQAATLKQRLGVR